VAEDANGDFVVVWESNGQAGPYHDVFGQRYSSNGAKSGTEFQVNSFTTDEQSTPAVAMGGNADFVVVWQELRTMYGGFGVCGRRYSSRGAGAGSEFQINSYTSGFPGGPRVAEETTGDFTVTWTGGTQDGDGSGVFGQRYTNTGAKFGSEFQ